MYVDKRKTATQINFLDSEKFISFTKYADPSVLADQTKDGMLPAGSIFPKNDGSAEGITINDVDLSKGTQPVGVIVEGYINAKRLPTTPAAAAITALSKITFSNIK
ncbi:hypothetical protein FHQ08_03445 [Lactobacillus sp. CC-MHH1034]|uniref:hypothetical protein n=1 Tax=Agrilactobacillus fermenti TaxID=2586909 RepID=UPI001E49FE10|nr:hypothetical protein [Agrilactobacillus fermenti]MCD2255770.1 hypothetical protein [Agrilactobacillus fermenti]